MFLGISRLQKNYKATRSGFSLFDFFFFNLVLLFSLSKCLEKYYLEDTAVLNIILSITNSNGNILPKPHCFCIKTSLELIT